jgi:hypothetical protein
MFKKTRKIAMIGAALAAVSFGGSALAAAGAAPTQPAPSAVQAQAQKGGDAEVADGTTAIAQKGDAETADDAGQKAADAETADGTNSAADAETNDGGQEANDGETADGPEEAADGETADGPEAGGQTQE